MRRSLVIGKTNVGKTLFCVHFAKYLGIRELHWLVERAGGSTEDLKMTVEEAERTLSGPVAHRTREMQSIRMSFPRGKGIRELLLTDSTGLTDGVHPEATVREAMAQTLEALVGSTLVLHLVDAYDLGRAFAGETSQVSRESPLSEIDLQISKFAAQRNGYVVLANKIDLPGAEAGYRKLKERLPGLTVIPISALHQTGFREVKQHVWRMV